MAPQRKVKSASGTSRPREVEVIIPPEQAEANEIKASIERDLRLSTAHLNMAEHVLEHEDLPAHVRGHYESEVQAHKQLVELCQYKLAAHAALYGEPD